MIVARFAAILLALIAAPGCESLTGAASGPSESALGGAAITLEVDRTSYAPEMDIVVRLNNGLDEPIGYNACTIASEVEADGRWRRIESLRLCTAAIYTLESGESVSFSEPVDGWARGRYRLVLSVHRFSAQRTEVVTSSAFTIER